MKKTFRTLTLVILGVMLILCVWPYVWFYNLLAPRMDTGARRAAPVILALEAYHQDYGYYPPNLDALMSAYLDKLPTPGGGQTFRYRQDYVDRTYTLAFVPRGEAVGDGWYFYSSETGTWSRSDSGFADAGSP
jgi:hypothetical protein